MGGSGSKLEKALAEVPDDERYFGLENFGNTCYCNSVLQALYFCRPFREKVLQYAANLPKDAEENLLTCLADLFMQINTQKKKTGFLPPKKFVQRLKRDNELFQGFMHQDAHEFLNFLLNRIGEILEGPEKNGRNSKPSKTWVHDIFQGKLVNETRCLQCETVTSREEVFMDLSLEIDQNCSLTKCLKNFSAIEMLDKDDKFFCDNCCSLQEAQKWMKIRELPECLIFHLKRFKYVETAHRLRKLMYRVVFPLELKLSRTSDNAACADAAYALFAVVVHVGNSPQHGHYVTLIKSHQQWLFFDDDQVETINESLVQTTFGSTQDYGSHLDHGYILFYERVHS